MAHRRNRRPAAAKHDIEHARQAKTELAKEHTKNQTTEIQNLKQHVPCQVYLVVLLLPWCSVGIFIYLSALASALGVDLQSMLSLQWDAALKQWSSKVTPKLASPQLSMAFFLIQDAAFVCALAW